MLGLMTLDRGSWLLGDFASATPTHTVLLPRDMTARPLSFSIRLECASLLVSLLYPASRLARSSHVCTAHARPLSCIPQPLAYVIPPNSCG